MDRDDFIKKAGLINKIGQKCKENELEFYYHNHAHEFKLFNGVYGFNMLYKETDPEFVKAEIDTYWVKYAGLDSAEYIRTYAGRCPLVHLKDTKDNESRDFAEIGSGTAVQGVSGRTR